ncbi:MAG: hypothetical protein AMJ41_01195 [candidate division Zixibacteria bacterium DG_27]|nr:MAG: hypothetical protein AMJ41_01195 [candidate division Zixibacteria bacterium DG_27]
MKDLFPWMFYAGSSTGGISTPGTTTSSKTRGLISFFYARDMEICIKPPLPQQPLGNNASFAAVRQTMKIAFLETNYKGEKCQA